MINNRISFVDICAKELSEFLSKKDSKILKVASQLQRVGSGRLVREGKTRLFNAIQATSPSSPLSASALRQVAKAALTAYLGPGYQAASVAANVMQYVASNDLLKRALTAPLEETKVLLKDKLKAALDPVHLFFGVLDGEKMLQKIEAEVEGSGGLFTSFFSKKGLNFFKEKNRFLKFLIRSFSKYVEMMQQNPRIAPFVQAFSAALKNPEERAQAKNALIKALQAELYRESPWIMRVWNKVFKHNEACLKDHLNAFTTSLRNLDQEWLGAVALKESWIGDPAASEDVLDVFCSSYLPFVFSQISSIPLKASLEPEEVKKFYLSLISVGSGVVQEVPILEPLTKKIIQPLTSKTVETLFSDSLDPKPSRATFWTKFCSRVESFWARFKLSLFTYKQDKSEAKRCAVYDYKMLTKI